MVVFVELPHEVSLVRQAEDRAHRKGQAAKAVNVYFLCAQVRSGRNLITGIDLTAGN